MDGTNVENIIPKQILSDEYDILHLCAADEYTLILIESGKVFGIGKNNVKFFLSY